MKHTLATLLLVCLSSLAMEVKQPLRKINWHLLNQSQIIKYRTPKKQEELDRKLWYACDRLEEENIKELLSEGADPKRVLKWHVPPLHLLARYCYSNHVRRSCALMLEYGGDPNIRYSGEQTGTALMEIVRNSVCEEIEEACAIFLAYGANPNLQDHQGKTALMYARTAGVCKILLDAGANMFTRDFDGNTVLHCTVINLDAKRNSLMNCLFLDHPNRSKLLITLLACMKYHHLASTCAVYELHRRYKILVPYLMQYTRNGFAHLKNNEGKSSVDIWGEPSSIPPYILKQNRWEWNLNAIHNQLDE